MLCWILHTKQNLINFLGRHTIRELNTRHKFHLDIPHRRLAKSGNSFKINYVKFINRPESAFLSNNSSFKTKLNNCLLDNPLYSIQEILECKIDVQV